jgi:hypothetical protein
VQMASAEEEVRIELGLVQWRCGASIPIPSSSPSSN